MTLPWSEMPTLSLLYKKDSIPSPRTPHGADSDASPFPTNASFNDKICLIRYDITKLEVDAIVNAANSALRRGGGVDGAIHQAAGPELQEACDNLPERGCETGNAKMTPGFRLPAKYVVHAVGPIFYQSREQECRSLLKSCYQRSLEVAVEAGLKSIAFSALSTGIYGYPSTKASEAALEAVREFLDTGKADEMERIVFCNFLPKDVDAYYEVIAHYFPPATQADEAEPKPTSTDEAELASKLPDAPTKDPKDTTPTEEPTAKKQKTDTEDDDFVVVEKEDAAPTESSSN